MSPSLYLKYILLVNIYALFYLTQIISMSETEEEQNITEMIKIREKLMTEPTPEQKDDMKAKIKSKQEAIKEAQERREQIVKEMAKLKEKEKTEIKAEQQAKIEAKQEALKEARERREQIVKERAELREKREARKEAKHKAKKEAKQIKKQAKKEAKQKAKKEAKEKSIKEAEEKAKQKAEQKAKQKADQEAEQNAEAEARENTETEDREKDHAESIEESEKEREKLERSVQKAKQKDKQKAIQKAKDHDKGKCGFTENSDSIVGRRIAEEDTYPWLGVLQVNGQFHCSVNIIDDWWVLLGAHAFLDLPKNLSMFSIGVGNIERNKATIYGVSKIIAQSYDPETKQRDIALMKIKGPIKFNKSVRSICLPRDNNTHPKVGKVLKVAGWEYKSGKKQTKMKEVGLTLISNKECAEIYEQIGMTINNSQICTKNNRKKGCQAHTGGPAIEVINGFETLVGLVSYGIACADDNPGVYTKVSHYVEWIEKNIETH